MLASLLCLHLLVFAPVVLVTVLLPHCVVLAVKLASFTVQCTESVESHYKHTYLQKKYKL